MPKDLTTRQRYHDLTGKAAPRVLFEHQDRSRSVLLVVLLVLTLVIGLVVVQTTMLHTIYPGEVLVCGGTKQEIEAAVKMPHVQRHLDAVQAYVNPGSYLCFGAYAIYSDTGKLILDEKNIAEVDQRTALLAAEAEAHRLSLAADAALKAKLDAYVEAQKAPAETPSGPTE